MLSWSLAKGFVRDSGRTPGILAGLNSSPLNSPKLKNQFTKNAQPSLYKLISKITMAHYSFVTSLSANKQRITYLNHYSIVNYVLTTP